MATYKTPGVYITETNGFPQSVVGVPTAVPVFIGYTEKAQHNGKDLTYIPTKISSLLSYNELFGGAHQTKFVLSNTASSPVDLSEESLTLNGKNVFIKYKPNHELYFYHGLRFFYLNGGGECYILSVGSYTQAEANGIAANDFFGTDDKKNVFKILEKEPEPTLVLLPDVVAKKPTPTDPGAYTFYLQVLQHCNTVKSRFGIFDVARPGNGNSEDAIALFRQTIVADGLKYGAAYYPWLKTTVVGESEIDCRNIDDFLNTLKAIIPAAETKAVQLLQSITPPASPADNEAAALQFHQSLLATSNTYKQLMAALQAKLNLLPPSSAMAGIYTAVDNTRGVWKAPANVSVNGVTAPEVNITSDQQQLMNVDPVSGKSINIIRSFTGEGTLVWGARTLDGNSNDWRYINVRRTMIFIEQSLQLALRSYVFEPNDANTWVTIKSMIENFLFNLWKQGALAGNKPEVAFGVQVGLGISMTADDILNGVLRATILVSLLRPAEFIEITFQQQQQKA